MDAQSTEDPKRDLADYPVIELYKECEGVKKVIIDFKLRQMEIETEIAGRVATPVKAAIEASGKSHGTMRAVLTNTLSAKIDVGKKVDWDNAKLMAVAQTLPWERVAAIFKIEWSVPEKIFAGIVAANPELAKLLNAARTVTYLAPKVTLEVAEGAA